MTGLPNLMMVRKKKNPATMGKIKDKVDGISAVDFCFEAMSGRQP
jgi:hypothetical protein